MVGQGALKSLHLVFFFLNYYQLVWNLFIKIVLNVQIYCNPRVDVYTDVYLYFIIITIITNINILYSLCYVYIYILCILRMFNILCNDSIFFFPNCDIFREYLNHKSKGCFSRFFFFLLVLAFTYTSKLLNTCRFWP